MRLVKIVSGGQTGVDRAALQVALELGIPCGGWCPRGRRAEDGVIPDRYPVRETRDSRYSLRTELNVRDSDGTLIVTRGPIRGGTALTLRYARSRQRPCFVANLELGVQPVEIAAWLNFESIAVLNVAGPRESQCPGVEAQCRELLLAVIDLL